MQVIVKARHTRVPAALKKMAESKVQKVRRYFDRIDKIEIEFSEEHNPRVARKHHVEVTVSAPNHVLRAAANGTDPAAAVDLVVDKLQAQVLRLKDKMVKRGRTGNAAKTIRVPAKEPAKARAGKAAKADRVESAPSARGGVRVRRTGRFSVEPMTPKEAALQLQDANGDLFLPFVNAETDQVSVVYRRDDGGFGLMEPAE